MSESTSVFVERMGRIIFALHKYTHPAKLVLVKSARNVLDLGCGNGQTASILQLRKLYYTVGLDIHKPNLVGAKKRGSHDEFILADGRHLPFQGGSFDIVLCLHVLEHFRRQAASDMVGQLESISNMQVLIATPIGFMPHGEVDENPYERHLSGFSPEEFIKWGYNIRRVGIKRLFGHQGIVHRKPHTLLSRTIFALEPLMNLVFDLLPMSGDYYFIASKKACLKIPDSSLASCCLHNILLR